MTITNKDFVIKNGLSVNNAAFFNNGISFNNIVLSSVDGRLSMKVNEIDYPIANMSDITSFTPVDIPIYYNGV